MRKILFILTALSLSSSAVAQSPQERNLSMAQSTLGVTLEYCQSKAREHYPLVAKYDLITISEKYDLSAAARGLIPQLTVSGQATWQNAVATFPEQFSQILQAMGTDMPLADLPFEFCMLTVYTVIMDTVAIITYRKQA